MIFTSSQIPHPPFRGISQQVRFRVSTNRLQMRSGVQQPIATTENKNNKSQISTYNMSRAIYQNNIFAILENSSAKCKNCTN